VECGIADRVEISIFTIAAELVHHAELSGMDWTTRNGECVYEYTWDVSHIASGVYLYMVKAHKQGEGTIKIIKKLAVIK
jgi:hypothetical protein